METEEKGIQKLGKKLEWIIMTGVIAGLIGICGIVVSSSIKKEENIKKYNQIFLEDINKKPQITKRDSIYFYQKHNLEKYIVYNSDIKLLDIPYSKIKRIVKRSKE